MIDWKLVDAPKWEAMDRLKPMLDGYRSHQHEVYIGVTSEPVLRWNQHVAENWTRMVVVYEALNSKIAIALERDLIDYARRCNFKKKIANLGDGGEGIRGSGGERYLYFLLR